MSKGKKQVVPALVREKDLPQLLRKSEQTVRWLIANKLLSVAKKRYKDGSRGITGNSIRRLQKVEKMWVNAVDAKQRFPNLKVMDYEDFIIKSILKR